MLDPRPEHIVQARAFMQIIQPWFIQWEPESAEFRHLIDKLARNFEDTLAELLTEAYEAGFRAGQRV